MDPVRILWVKANKLLPASSGGDIRSYNILRQLACQHEVTLLSYYDGTPDSAYEADLQKHFPGAECVCTRKRVDNIPRSMIDFAMHFLSPMPYAVSRFASADIREKLASWYRMLAFDVVVCDFVDAAVNFPEKLAIPSVLFQHNVETEIWRRYARTESNIARKSLYALEFRKMRHYEQKIVQKFHHVIAVSEHDRELMSRWRSPLRISVVPTGVDVAQFTSAAARSVSQPLILFVGAMDWKPNIDAVEFFCAEVLPHIHAKVPEARFRIVGRNPGQRVQNLRSGAVEVTGTVSSVLEHLQAAAIVVVPLRVAGGTRLKIYEAMAAGKAIVSTSIGAEGLDVHPGQDIILADNAEEFADAAVMLIRDSKLRKRYESAAAELALQYDWRLVGQKFVCVLQEAVAAESDSTMNETAGMREA